jgi:O-antigen/teichoic acid export membrane protein
MKLDNSSEIQTQETEDREAKIRNRNILTAARGSGVLAVGRFFNIGGRLLVVLLLARVLGAEQYGIYNLAMSAATLATAIGLFGLDDAMLRYIAIYAGRKDQEGLWGAVLLGIGGTIATGILTGITLFLVADPLSTRVFHQPDLAPLLKVLSLVVPFLALSSVLIGIAHGFKKMQYSVIAEDVGQLLIRFILLGILSLIGLNAMTTVIVFGISDVLSCLALVYLLNKDLEWGRPTRSARFEIREIMSYALPLWLSAMMSKFRNNINTIILGSVSSAVNVGVYALISRANVIGHVSYLSIVRSVRPVLADLSSRGAHAQMESIYQTSTRWMLLLNLPIFILLVLFPNSVLALFGSSYATGAKALVILACAELFDASTGVCGSIIDMGGYTGLKLFNAISQLGVLVGLNLLLVPTWGMVGTTTAVLLSVVYVNLLRIIEVWVIFRILPYNIGFIKPVLAGLAACAAAMLTARLFDQSVPLVLLIGESVIIFLVMAAILLLLGLAPEDRLIADQLFQRVNSIYIRKRGVFTRYLMAKLP